MRSSLMGLEDRLFNASRSGWELKTVIKGY